MREDRLQQLGRGPQILGVDDMEAELALEEALEADLEALSLESPEEAGRRCNAALLEYLDDFHCGEEERILFMDGEMLALRRDKTRVYFKLEGEEQLYFDEAKSSAFCLKGESPYAKRLRKITKQVCRRERELV